MPKTSIGLNNQFDLLGRFSCLNGTELESFPVTPDAPVVEAPPKPKKKTSWLAALGFVAVAAVVATVAIVAAPATLTVGVAVCIGVCAGTSIVVDAFNQSIDKGVSNIDWAEVVISGSCGAISGACATIPGIGVWGQMAINGVLGGTSTATTGGDTKEVITNTALGIISGKLGGAGYRPTGLHFYNAAYRKLLYKGILGKGFVFGNVSNERHIHKFLTDSRDKIINGVEDFGNTISDGINKLEDAFAN